MPNRRFLLAVWIIVLVTTGACSEASTATGTDAAATPPADAAPPDGTTIADAALADAPPAAADAAIPDASVPDATTPVADATLPDAPVTVDTDGGTPPTVVLSQATTTTTIGGHTTYSGSVMVTDLCPAGHVVTGAIGHLRNSVDGYNGPIQIICRPIAAAAGPPVLVTLGDPAVDLPLRGAPLATDVVWTRECPANQVVVGLQGRAGAIIDQVVLRCAALGPSATDAHALDVGAPAALAPAGGTGGSAFGPFDCPAGAIARGAVIYHSGDPGFGLAMQFLDGLGFVCSTAVLQ